MQQQQQQQQQQYQIEQWILQSNDPTNPIQQRDATYQLQQWTTTSTPTLSSTTDAGGSIGILIPTLFAILQQTNHTIVQFYCFNTISTHILSIPSSKSTSNEMILSDYYQWRLTIRNYLVQTWPVHQYATAPSFLVKKVASIVAKFFIQQVGTFEDQWETIEHDLYQNIAYHYPEFFLLVIYNVIEDFISSSDTLHTNNSEHGSVSSMQTPSIATATSRTTTNNNNSNAPTSPLNSTSTSSNYPLLQSSTSSLNRNAVTITHKQTRQAKEYLKGYRLLDGTETTNSNRPNPTPLQRIFDIVVTILATNVQHLYHHNTNRNGNSSIHERMVRSALKAIKNLFLWTEMIYLGDTEILQRFLDIVLSLIHWVPSPYPHLRVTSGQTTKPLHVSVPIGLVTIDVWKEWITSSSTTSTSSNSNGGFQLPADLSNSSSISTINDPKLPILQALLERIHESNILPTATTVQAIKNEKQHQKTQSVQNGDDVDDDEDESIDTEYIELIISTAQLVNSIGLEIYPLYVSQQSQQQQQQQQLTILFNGILDLFFRAFAYDDIDVSAAVLPFATRLCPLLTEDTNTSANGANNSLRQHVPAILNILYTQLKYPADFTYEFDDDNEVNSEEEQYRIDLCKLYTKIVRVAPQICLQFLAEAVNSQLAAIQVHATTATSPPTALPTAQDIEATLRLLHVYCEGIHPPPGLKVVMKNSTFRSILIQLHTSTALIHPQQHSAVLCWYYDVTVRYYPIFMEGTDPNEQQQLLSHVLNCITGSCGLQHTNIRVRSRCCYLLLRFVKSVVTLLRPFMETAVSGIQNLLEQSYAKNTSLTLLPDDTLHLFETMGILLSKTGLNAVDQQRYLTAVMTPHVTNIRQILASPGLHQDPDHYGEILALSIAAIGQLSKGFTKKPADEIQAVLVETVNITYAVLEAVPTCEQVRNKAMVLFQRMIYYGLGYQFIQLLPQLLYILIEHCTTEDTIFVAQIFNQVCIKLKQDAAPAIDSVLLPFVRKCNQLVIQQQADTSNRPGAQQGDYVAPHIETEQLAIEKLLFVVLQHIVTYHVTGVLVSPTNQGHLEMILLTMSDGAIRVADPIVKKTCFRFFRELLEQWSPLNATNNVQHQPPLYYNIPDSYRHNLCTFLCQVLIPGTFDFMLKASFDERDANQSRIVSEYATVLFLIKSRYSSMSTNYYHDAILQQLTTTLGQQHPSTFVSEVLNAFNASKSVADIERCLKEYLKIVKEKQN